ncbi:hypothetical protein N665_0057s0036 [Sinapis alba]|nr:hypothetical protein N665_0057s0036 [Sinapis alba]
MEKVLNLKRKEPSSSSSQDEVIRRYLTRDPCQPRGHIFKQKSIGGVMRRFNPDWFDQYGNWLEYSVKKDVAYCLSCYFFRDTNGKEHVGQVNSFHNNAAIQCENLMRKDQSIKHALHKQNDITKNKNFVELLKYTSEQQEVVSKVVLQNAPGNNQMVSSKLHKDIAHCFEEEVIKSIIEEINHDVFGLLVDEPVDFVDKSEIVKERFISITHVAETSSAYLKSAIDSLFAKLRLSIKKLKEQGYDGASNMKAVAKKHFEVGGFFDMISPLLNVIGVSCKRKFKIREDHRKMIEEDILDGDIRQTRWGSPIINVLKHIETGGTEDAKKRQAYGFFVYFHNFDFVFYLHMMIHLLGLSDSISKSLQQGDQDILNAMSLVKSTKRQLQDDSKTLEIMLQEFNNQFTEVNTELLNCV